MTCFRGASRSMGFGDSRGFTNRGAPRRALVGTRMVPAAAFGHRAPRAGGRPSRGPARPGGPAGREGCPDGWSWAWTTIRTGRGHAGAVLTAAGLDTSVEALPARHGLASVPKEPHPRDARATGAAEG